MRLDRVVALVVGAGALACVGALYVYGRRRVDERAQEDGDAVSELADAVKTATGTRVLDREHSQPDARFDALLDDWEKYGTHVIRVANGVYSGHRYVGGERDQAQQTSDFSAGLSKASGPETAPHMHKGGARDFWPRFFVPNHSFEEQPTPDDIPLGQSKRDYFVSRFQVFADFARARGFVAGFYWKTPDMPHIEVSDWRALPVVAG